jgi:plastocyanin
VRLYVWGAPINEATLKRLLARLAALLSVALLLGAPNAGAQSQNLVTVSIRDFYFEPFQLTIDPGTTVRWVNEGTTQHTVFATSPAGAFLSGTLNPGESFTYTFPQRFPRPSPDSTAQPGTYRYFCKIHPEMKGSVAFGAPPGEGTTVQQPPTPTDQQPPTVPRTGGFSPILPLGLLVVVTVGLLGWAIKRRSS